MAHTLFRRLAPLGLALTLAVPALAAGMDTFVPDGTYPPGPGMPPTWSRP